MSIEKVVLHAHVVIMSKLIFAACVMAAILDFHLSWKEHKVDFEGKL